MRTTMKRQDKHLGLNGGEGVLITDLKLVGLADPVDLLGKI